MVSMELGAAPLLNALVIRLIRDKDYDSAPLVAFLPYTTPNDARVALCFWLRMAAFTIARSASVL